MIYACKKPIEEYVVIHKGGVYGIYDTYCTRPDVLKLIMIGTEIPYQYEQEGLDPGDVQVTIAREELLTDTLKETVGGLTVKEILRECNPSEVRDKFKESPETADLTLVRKAYPSVASFMEVVNGRVAVWESSYRGKVESKGNIIQVSFGGKDGR